MNAAETVVLRKKLRRKEMVGFFEKIARTVVGIEACGASHHWARLLQSFGHTVKLIMSESWSRTFPAAMSMHSTTEDLYSTSAMYGWAR